VRERVSFGRIFDDLTGHSSVLVCDGSGILEVRDHERTAVESLMSPGRERYHLHDDMRTACHLSKMCELFPHYVGSADRAAQYPFVQDRPQLGRVVSLKYPLPLHAGSYQLLYLILSRANAG
jgi:hypothetical protein